MNAPRFAKLSASLLAQSTRLDMPETDSLAPPPPIDIENRARAISAIERAIREKARRKNRIRWIAGGVAMAASVAAIVSVKSFTHAEAPLRAASNAPDTGISLALAHATGDVSIASETGTTAGTDGANLAAGTHVVTKSGGHAVLALSTGTRLAVDESSDFSVVEEDATQIFSLGQGSMRADVAKLKPGQRFIIRTSDSEVEVHGTSFTVSVEPAAAAADPACGGTVTRVVVFEGIVTVRHDGVEARVPKGSSWPAGCASVTGSNDSNSANGTPVLELPNDTTASNDSNDDKATDDKSAPRATTAHEKSRPARQAKKSSSPLSEQNDIFESGLTAERDGLVAGAISDYERYLSLYPNGPLAEHATVRRMNLLHTVDPTRALTAAKEYLARYPNGFARGEAEAIVSEKR